MTASPNRIESFRHAFRGVAAMLREEVNPRIHAAATVAVVALGLWLGLPARDWALLVLAIGAVWSAEAANRALELLADRVAPDPHPLVGLAKDTAAGAVLLAALAAAGVGGLVLGAPLGGRFFGP